MKVKRLFGNAGFALALGMVGMTSVVAVRAQDQPAERNDEPVALKQAGDSGETEKPREQESERHHRRSGEDVVMVRNDFFLKKDESSGDVVVVSGDATIEGEVRGDLVVVAGSARIFGKVDGEVVVVLGSATLGNASIVKDNLRVIGGRLIRAPGATIEGTPQVFSTLGVVPNLEWVKAYIRDGPMWGRPIAPQVPLVWIVAGISLIIYLLIALLFPRPIQVCVQTLEKRPIGSFFMGVLLFVLLGPLTFLLAVSVVGIVVIPFLFCALVVSFLFGRVAVYRFAGGQIGKQLNLPTFQLPLVAFLVGTLIFDLLYTIPVLGFLVWAVIIPFGVGAAWLAAFGGLRREGNVKNAVAAVPAVAMATVAAAPTGEAEPPVMRSTLSPADFISMPRAGFWVRTCATLLDALLFVLVFIVVGPRGLLLWLVYHVAMWAWKGTTIGGIVMGIKLVRVDGRPIDVGVALVRGAASIFSALILGIGFFWAGWNREKQSWHDKIAGTVMVTVPRGVPLL